MSGWRRCGTCRKVRPAAEFDVGLDICQPCLAGPAPRKRAAPVVRTRATAPASPSAGPPLPRTGSVGSGDLEVRERRARRAALDALVEAHPEEFDGLLQGARRAEGLRAPSA